MKRSTPLRVNRRRQRERYERDFGAKAVWIRSLPCVGCRRPGPSDPHHERSRGAGGTSEDLVPLCAACHHEGHAEGWKTWQREAGVDLRAEAKRLEEEWRTRCRETAR